MAAVDEAKAGGDDARVPPAIGSARRRAGSAANRGTRSRRVSVSGRARVAGQQGGALAKLWASDNVKYAVACVGALVLVISVSIGNPAGFKAFMTWWWQVVWTQACVLVWGLFSSPLRYEDLSFNFIATQVMAVLGVAGLTVLVVSTKDKWGEKLVVAFSNRPMRSAVLKHFVLPSLQPHMLVGPCLVLGIMFFEFLIPDTRSCLTEQPIQWLALTLFYAMALGVYHGAKLGLFTHKKPWLEAFSFVFFCFSIGMSRLHTHMWQPVVDDTGAVISGGHSVATVLRVSVPFFCSAILIGFVTVMPVLWVADYTDSRFAGNDWWSLSYRLGSQYATNATVCLYGVRMAAYTASVIEPFAANLQPLDTAVEYGVYLFMAGTCFGVFSFYWWALKTLLAGSPIGRMDFLRLRRIRVGVAMRRGTARITPKKIQGFVKQLFGQFGSGSALSTARGAANTAVRLVHTLAQGTLLWRTIHKQVFELDASCLIRVDNSRSGVDFILPLITFELKGFKSEPDGTRRSHVIMRATTTRELKVVKNSNGYIQVKFRIVVFGEVLRLVTEQRAALESYDLTMYIDRGWLPKFPVPILTMKDGKIATSGILQRGQLGDTDREWLQEQLAKAVTAFQSSELIEVLTAHKDDEAYDEINAAKDLFLETMEAIKAKRSGKRVNAHLDATLGGGIVDDDLGEFDDDFDERGNTVADLLVAATLHLTSMYFAGEDLNINTRQFNATLTSCATSLLTLFYQEFLSRLVDDRGRYQVQETIVLGLVMFVLQQAVALFGPGEVAPESPINRVDRPPGGAGDPPSPVASPSPDGGAKEKGSAAPPDASSGAPSPTVGKPVTFAAGESSSSGADAASLTVAEILAEMARMRAEMEELKRSRSSGGVAAAGGAAAGGGASSGSAQVDLATLSAAQRAKYDDLVNWAKRIKVRARSEAQVGRKLQEDGWPNAEAAASAAARVAAGGSKDLLFFAAKNAAAGCDSGGGDGSDGGSPAEPEPSAAGGDGPGPGAGAGAGAGAGVGAGGAGAGAGAGGGGGHAAMMAEMLRRRNLNHVETDRESGASTPTSQQTQDPHMDALKKRLAELERLKRQKALAQLVERHEDVMTFVQAVNDFAWRTDTANSLAAVRELLGGLDELLASMTDLGLDLGDDAEHFLKRAHVSNPDSFRPRVDWKAMFTDLEVSEAQQGLEYDADEIEDIDAVCQLLCKLARCKALISSVESWVESAQANVPERGTQKVPRLHENVLERLDRAEQMDRWFQNHGQGDLFVSALMAVFPLGPSQELAAQARRRMWDEAVRMVTTLVRRTEGAYRVGCSSSHKRRHAKEAALSMAEEPGAVSRLAALAARPASRAFPPGLVCSIETVEALKARVAKVKEAVDAQVWELPPADAELPPSSS